MSALERPAGHATDAGPARLGERADHVIADVDLADIGTHGSDDARHLVAEHRRQWDEIVSGEREIGVAESGRPHVNEHFTPDRRGDLDVFDVKPATECVNDKRSHTRDCG